MRQKNLEEEMNRKIASFAAAAAIAATMAVAGPAQNVQAQELGARNMGAQNTVLLSQDAGRCEIFRALSRIVPGECLPGYQKARALVRHDKKLPAPQPALQPEPPEQLSMAMMVTFELNSAQLTAESRNALDNIATVLSDRLMNESAILIEGHADSSGPETYNQSLSEQRANAVRRYLVQRHGITGDRLFAFGRGELELYDPAHPFASVNRRVEFANVSG